MQEISHQKKIEANFFFKCWKKRSINPELNIYSKSMQLLGIKEKSKHYQIEGNGKIFITIKCTLEENSLNRNEIISEGTLKY